MPRERRRPGAPGGRRHAGAAAADWPGAGGVAWALPGWSPAALPAWLGRCLAAEAERRRLFAWVAVVFGTGVLAAFAADGPLATGPPLLLGAAAAGGAVSLRGRFVAFCLLVAVAAWAAGFAAAAIRIAGLETPRIGRTVVSRTEGFVIAIEERQRGGRVLIRPTTIEGIAAEALPKAIRVTTRDLAGLAPGDYVSGRTRLLPPPEAARPGGYDFARDAYFRGVGGVGSTIGSLAKLDPPLAPDVALKAAAAVDRARNALTRRIAETIGGQPGAVAAALITGKRGLIDDHSNDVLRAAGIYHVVSISGLHMVLAAGTVFWLARALLALVPALALRWPIKKIAALCGMAGATAYCVFSGADVATERSLIMIVILQGAILFDRPALSFRNLALSALVVLAREPESLLGPSFQMSYAAVAGLIALAEWQRGRGLEKEGGGGLVGRTLRAGARLAFGAVATTVVASIATAPFSAYHFQNLQPYGVVGNAATLPLVSLAVMPSAVLGVLAHPFGLDRPVWWLMGQAVAAVLALSEWVAGFGGSVVIVPAFGAGALLWLSLAILLATLPATGLRLLALGPAAIGFALMAMPGRPDIQVARDGSGAAVRAGDGRLVVIGRVQPFTVEQWLRADGDARRPADPSLKAGLRCDGVGCTVRTATGDAVALVNDRRAFAEDCRRAAVVVSRFVAPSNCRPPVLLDRTWLVARGATSLRRGEAGYAIETVKRPDDTRPWLQPRRPAPVARSPVVRPPDRLPAAPVPGPSRASRTKPGALPAQPGPAPPARDPAEPDADLLPDLPEAADPP